MTSSTGGHLQASSFSGFLYCSFSLDIANVQVTFNAKVDFESKQNKQKAKDTNKTTLDFVKTSIH